MVSLITGGVGILAAALIIMLMRRDRLHVNHGLGWIIVAISFVLLGFSPGIVDWLALRLGVAYPPTLALTVGFVILVIKILSMDIERSRIEVRNQRLVQRIALLEADIKALHNAIEDRRETVTEITSPAVGERRAN